MTYYTTPSLAHEIRYPAKTLQALDNVLRHEIYSQVIQCMRFVFYIHFLPQPFRTDSMKP